MKKKMKKESKRRNIDKDEAWDNVNYTTLEVDDDFIQKALAIKAGEDYNTDVSIPLDLPDDLLMFAFKAAHEQNITFNEYVNNALRSLIDRVNDGEITKEDAKKWMEQNQPAFPIEDDEK
jgi:Arc/MetJ family transcription regulator